MLLQIRPSFYGSAARTGDITHIMGLRRIERRGREGESEMDCKRQRERVARI